MGAPSGLSGFSRSARYLSTMPSIGGPEHIVADVLAPMAGQDQLVQGRYTRNAVRMAPRWETHGDRWIGALVCRDGRNSTPDYSAAELAPDFSPAVSPDGRRVAFGRSSGSQCRSSTARPGCGTQVQRRPEAPDFSEAANHSPVWTPDGRKIIFISGQAVCGGWRLPASQCPNDSRSVMRGHLHLTDGQPPGI